MEFLRFPPVGGLILSTTWSFNQLISNVDSKIGSFASHDNAPINVHNKKLKIQKD
jgi:hypothetical protein